MKQFFKFFFASCLGFIIGSVLLTLIGIGIISAIASSGDGDVEVKDNSVLYINMANPVVDHTTSEPISLFGNEGAIGLDEIKKSLKYAQNDEHIKGIFLELTGVDAGMATIEELRNDIIAFKKSGKFVYAYSDVYTQGAYYLASAADKVYVNPTGSIDFKGLAASLVFVKGTLEKLGVEPQIIRHGKFKSAIEPLINDKMSPANREQTRTYLNALWNQMLTGIANSRKMQVTDLQNIADNLLITDGAAAVKYKLADGALYKDQVLDLIKGKTGAEEINKINFVTLNNYIKVEKPIEGDPTKKIAVIFAEGDIVDGKGADDNIGSATLARRLRDARLDDKVKAVVLRINSPGGSALASDIIWREVILTKKVKPVIVSMGNLAASGGYYIACAADTIVAQPNTITGSIGVFGVLWNAAELNNKMGVSIDTVKTGKMADIGTLSRPLTEGERKMIQDEIERIYDTFITHVAEGRRMSKADVDSIGQGRVWSGIDAKSKGLVDVLGGLDVAISIAAKKAKLDNYMISYVPRAEKGINKIVKQLTGQEDDNVKALLQNELGVNYKYIEYLKKARSIKGIQARLPYEIEIE